MNSSHNTRAQGMGHYFLGEGKGYWAMPEKNSSTRESDRIHSLSKKLGQIKIFLPRTAVEK